MAHRRDQHQGADKVWRVERHGETEHPGERMNDHDRRLDAARRQRRAQRRGLGAGRGSRFAGKTLAPAVAGTINCEDAKALRGQPRGQRNVHIGEIA